MQILRTDVDKFPDYWRVTDAAGNLVGLLDPHHADLYDLIELVDTIVEPPPTPPTVDGTSYAPNAAAWTGFKYEIQPPGVVWEASSEGWNGKYVVWSIAEYHEWLRNLLDGRKD